MHMVHANMHWRLKIVWSSYRVQRTASAPNPSSGAISPGTELVKQVEAVHAEIMRNKSEKSE